MPVYDTPITTDDMSFQKVLKTGLPVVLYLYDKTNPALDDLFNKLAREHAGKLFIARVDAKANAQTYNQYGRPALPALVTLENGSVKSQAESVEPGTITEHVRYLIGQGAKPKAAQSQSTQSTSSPAKSFPVTDASFAKDVLESDTPVLVDFWAEWCGPCHRVAPSLEEIAREYTGKLKVAKLNIDENMRMAHDYQATSIPMLLLFKKGRVVGKLVGAHPKPNIEQMIKQNL